MVVVRIDRVTTRGGDRGETSLGDGRRVAKDDARVEAFGTVDEANAAIGVLRLHADAETDPLLARIQNDLFDLGADLCRPHDDTPRARLTEAPCLALEADVARLNDDLPALDSFVLPGGTPGAAQAHVVRTVVRRAERLVVALARAETVNPTIVLYLNRLSDLMFVLARYMNAGGAGDVLWVPAATKE